MSKFVCFLADCTKNSTDPSDNWGGFCSEHRAMFINENTDYHPRYIGTKENHIGMWWCTNGCGSEGNTKTILFYERDKANSGTLRCTRCGGKNQPHEGITLTEQSLFTHFQHCLKPEAIQNLQRKYNKVGTLLQVLKKEVPIATVRTASKMTLDVISKELQGKIPLLQTMPLPQVNALVHMCALGLVLGLELSSFDQKIPYLKEVARELRVSGMEKLLLEGIGELQKLLIPSLQEAHKEYQETITSETQAIEESTVTDQPKQQVIAQPIEQIIEA